MAMPSRVALAGSRAIEIQLGQMQRVETASAWAVLRMLASVVLVYCESALDFVLRLRKSQSDRMIQNRFHVVVFALSSSFIRW